MRGLLGITILPIILLPALGCGWVWAAAQLGAPPTMSTIVIPVEFQDKVFPPGFQTSSITTVLQQMATYFAEVSANRSSFNWQLHQRIVRLDRPLSYYGADREAPGDDMGGNPRGLLALIADTITKVDPEIDFSRFRYIIITHAGPDQAKTSRDELSPDIWSQTLFRIRPPITTRPEGYSIEGASIVSYTDPLGVWLHEMAHLIGQLPDMYVRGPGGPIHLVGPWSLMDQGAQLGEGRMPSHLDAWSKWVLGWLEFETVVLSGSSTTTLEAVNGNPRPRALRIPLVNGSFYVVEARLKRGFDSLLPGEGVIIYLVTPRNTVSETIVRVVDTRPDTRTLDDAVLGVQRVYVDRRNQVYIQVLSRQGGSFTLRVGMELTIQFSLAVPKRVFTLQPVPVNLTVRPLISGLTYELYVDGVLYDRGLVSQPDILHTLYFTPWRIGNHNITLVVNDSRNSVMYREVQQLAVEVHPLIPLALLLLIVATPILHLARRGSSKSSQESPDNRANA